MSRRGNGEGTIYHSDKLERWVGQYTVETGADGKQKRKSVYGKTRKEVKDKLNDIITKLNNGGYYDKSSVTVEQIAENIIEESKRLNLINQSTYNRHISTLGQMKKHPIAKTTVQKVNEKIILDYYEYLTDYSNSVITKNCQLLNRVMERALEDNIITHSPITSRTKKPKSKRQTKLVTAFTVDEQKRLLKAIKDKGYKYPVQTLISLYTGARMGEINALTVNSFDFMDHTMKISSTISRGISDKPIIGDTTKTYAGLRTITLNPNIEAVIKGYIENDYKSNPDELLFLDKNNRILTTSQVNLGFKRLCSKHGIGDNVNQHQLRHTFATRCIESGMPATVLQRILGHTDISTTINTYTNVFAEYERKQVDRTNEYLTESGLMQF